MRFLQVGAIGFCMGGALTFCAAQHCGVAAAVPFYGSPDPAVCNPASIKVPVQAHFGAADALKGFSDPEVGGKGGVAMSASCQGWCTLMQAQFGWAQLHAGCPALM